MDVKKYVIIGNGTAAIGCIEGIRSVDATGKITVISSENRHVYCRPLISYLLEGKTDTEKMKYRPDDFYEKTTAMSFMANVQFLSIAKIKLSQWMMVKPFVLILSAWQVVLLLLFRRWKVWIRWKRDFPL